MLQFKRGLQALILAGSVGCASRALADPQWSAAVTVGGGSAWLGEHYAPAFHLGGRGDVLFLRSRERDMAIGPYVAVGSEAFATFAVEGGAEWLVPAWADIPFVFAAGGFERSDGLHGWEPGVCGSVLWGPHGYNFHGAYDLSGGVFVEGRHAVGGLKDSAVILGVAIDLSVLAYPFVLAYGALAH